MQTQLSIENLSSVLLDGAAQFFHIRTNICTTYLLSLIKNGIMKAD
jgi:hypothetical protein